MRPFFSGGHQISNNVPAHDSLLAEYKSSVTSTNIWLSQFPLLRFHQCMVVGDAEQT